MYVDRAVRKAIIYTVTITMALTLILNFIPSQIVINNYQFTSVKPCLKTV